MLWHYSKSAKVQAPLSYIIDVRSIMINTTIRYIKIKINSSTFITQIGYTPSSHFLHFQSHSITINCLFISTNTCKTNTRIIVTFISSFIFSNILVALKLSHMVHALIIIFKTFYKKSFLTLVVSTCCLYVNIKK